MGDHTTLQPTVMRWRCCTCEKKLLKAFDCTYRVVTLISSLLFVDNTTDVVLDDDDDDDARYSIVYKHISCDAKNGTFGTLQLLESHEVDVLFGPLCSTGKLQVAFKQREQSYKCMNVF